MQEYTVDQLLIRRRSAKPRFLEAVKPTKNKGVSLSMVRNKLLTFHTEFLLDIARQLSSPMSKYNYIT